MISRSLVLLTASLLTAAAAPAFALSTLPSFPSSSDISPVLFDIPVPGAAAVPARVHVAQAVGTEQRYTWSVVKAEAGISIAGNVPNAALKSFLTVRAGNDATDTTIVTSGAPHNFIPYSLAGLDALNGLKTGRVGYSGSKWTLSGYAETQEALDSVSAALESAVDMADWVVFVEVTPGESAQAAETEAQPAVVQPPEMVATFLKWSVTRDADGNFLFDGAVPHAALQSYLRVRAGDGVSDNTEVGGTPPPDFITNALAAVEAAKSLQSGRVSYTGSKWTIGGYAESQDQINAIVEQLAASIDISDWIVFIEVAPEPATPEPEVSQAVEPEAPADIAVATPEFQFNALKSDGGEIALSGDVPSGAFGSYAGVIAGGVDGSALSVNAAAPDEFIGDATAAIRALNLLESGLLAFENGQWSLIGDALNDADAATVSAAITALPDGDAWTIDIAVIPVFQLCAEVVARFSDTHSILFAPGSSNLTPESAEVLAELASDLVKCPAADLHVEGHTDADGPDDSNMALSVARAEAVIAQLIELGLDDRRLYAIGYGETLPVATNDTTAGKAQNRRIVFELMR